MHRILIVDDDPHIRDVICFALEKAGFDLVTAKDGREALEAFDVSPPALIVLDVGLPEMDGLEVCRQIRKSSDVPILFLSARNDEIDRILGLEIGGDDYVTKPFSPRELVARIGVILRRARPHIAHGDDPTPLQIGALRMDPLHRSASFNGKSLSLTAIEFNILQAILSRPRMTFSREQIMTAAYPSNINVSDRTIDSHIRNIRAKLGKKGCENAVETVHGVGFRLGPCSPAH